jgi:hypothetical protein
MAAAEERAERARAALDVVSRDTVARERFIAGYTGSDDALLALQTAAVASRADLPARERLDTLRRTAFGRTHNLAEESAATAARRTIRDDERRRERNSEALERAILAVELTVVPNPPVPGLEDPTPPTWTTTRRTSVPRGAWIAPFVTLALAVGYGSTALTGSAKPAPSPSASDTPSVQRLAPVDPNIGALAGAPTAAEDWFTDPQTEQDKVGSRKILADLGIVANTTHFVLTTASGSGLWVAKGPDGSLCIVGVRPGTGGAFGTCATRDEFLRRGLSFTHGYDSIRWDGVRFSTSSYAD